MKDLNKYILEKAVENDICKEWAGKISSARSIDDFLQMYIAGIDFCLSNNFPSNTDLQRLAGEYINQYGIYIDQNFKLSDRRVIVALGACKGAASFGGYNAAQLYVKNNSSLDVRITGNARVFIDCFDQSMVTVAADAGSRCLVNIYGKAQVSTAGDGEIKLVQKLKDTY